jgi:hypothetical protein
MRGKTEQPASRRRQALKFGQHFANQIHRRLPRGGDKWHLNEVVLKIAGGKALVVASRGPGRPRARRPGPTAPRQARGQAAAEAADAITPRHDHR